MSQKGQGLVEYAMLLMIVSTVVIVILTFVGPDLCSAFNWLAGGNYCTPDPGNFNPDPLYFLAGSWLVTGAAYGLSRLFDRFRKK